MVSPYVLKDVFEEKLKEVPKEYSKEKEPGFYSSLFEPVESNFPTNFEQILYIFFDNVKIDLRGIQSDEYFAYDTYITKGTCKVKGYDEETRFQLEVEHDQETGPPDIYSIKLFIHNFPRIKLQYEEDETSIKLKKSEVIIPRYLEILEEINYHPKVGLKTKEIKDKPEWKK